MSKGNRQITFGAILSYLSILINVLVGLLFTPWLIAQLGDSQYGLYTLSNSLITLFLFDFGLSTATSRFVSKYHAEGNDEKIGDFLGVIYKFYLIIDAVIFVLFVILYFFLGNIYVKLTPDELQQFKIVYIITASFSVLNFPFVTLNGVLNAFEKFTQLKLADLLYRLITVGLMTGALFLDYGLFAIVGINAGVGLLVSLYKLITVKAVTPVKVNFRCKDRLLLKEIFGFSLWSALSALAQRLIFNITPSILGIVVTSSAIAVFGIISTVESYSYLISGAINGMFMPRISKIYADNTSEKDLMPLLLKVGRFQFALNGLICVGFFLVGRNFIDLWVGESYQDAYWGILLVILPGVFFNSLQIANTTAVVTQYVKEQAIINIVMGIVNVGLSFLLSYYFGVIGACISICIAYFIRVIALNVLYYKKMHLDIPKFMKECYFRMSLPVIVTALLGIGLNYLIPDKGWLIFGVKVAIIILFYLVLLFLIGLKSSERKQLFNKLKRKKGDEQ